MFHCVYTVPLRPASRTNFRILWTGWTGSFRMLSRLTQLCLNSCNVLLFRVTKSIEASPDAEGHSAKWKSRLQGSGMYDEYGKEEATEMANRNKNLQFIYTLAIGVVLLLSSNPAFATNDENHIQEIMAGVNGNSKIQFIVIKQEGGGNSWGPQAGETQPRVMLVFFDATGGETGKSKFPHIVPADANPHVIATQDFANLPA